MPWTLLEPPFQLTKGAQYAASLKLSWSENAFATDALVAEKFTAAGFTNVTVDLPNKRVEGVWSGDDADDVTLPSEVTSVWRWGNQPRP
jgi:hypothetical protein